MPSVTRVRIWERLSTLCSKLSEMATHGVSDADLFLCLVRGDAYAVAQRFWEFSGIFAAPVRLTIAMIFLYKWVAF